MNIIAYIVSGVSTVAFFALWFITSYQELFHKKCEVEAAKEHVMMHNALHIEAKYGPNEQCAKTMLDTSQMVYRESAKSYNKALNKTMNRFPGMIMGFYSILENEET